MKKLKKGASMKRSMLRELWETAEVCPPGGSPATDPAANMTAAAETPRYHPYDPRSRASSTTASMAAQPPSAITASTFDVTTTKASSLTVALSTSATQATTASSSTSSGRPMYPQIGIKDCLKRKASYDIGAAEVATKVATPAEARISHTKVPTPAVAQTSHYHRYNTRSRASRASASTSTITVSTIYDSTAEASGSSGSPESAAPATLSSSKGIEGSMSNMQEGQLGGIHQAVSIPNTTANPSTSTTSILSTSSGSPESINSATLPQGEVKEGPVSKVHMEKLEGILQAVTTPNSTTGATLVALATSATTSSFSASSGSSVPAQTGRRDCLKRKASYDAGAAEVATKVATSAVVPTSHTKAATPAVVRTSHYHRYNTPSRASRASASDSAHPASTITAFTFDASTFAVSRSSGSPESTGPATLSPSNVIEDCMSNAQEGQLGGKQQDDRAPNTTVTPFTSTTWIVSTSSGSPESTHSATLPQGDVKEGLVSKVQVEQLGDIQQAATTPNTTAAPSTSATRATTSISSSSSGRPVPPQPGKTGCLKRKASYDSGADEVSTPAVKQICSDPLQSTTTSASVDTSFPSKISPSTIFPSTDSVSMHFAFSDPIPVTSTPSITSCVHNFFLKYPPSSNTPLDPTPSFAHSSGNPSFRRKLEALLKQMNAIAVAASPSATPASTTTATTPGNPVEKEEAPASTGHPQWLVDLLMVINAPRMSRLQEGWLDDLLKVGEEAEAASAAYAASVAPGNSEPSPPPTLSPRDAEIMEDMILVNKYPLLFTAPSSDSVIYRLRNFRRCPRATSSPACRAMPATPASPGVSTSVGISSSHRICPAHHRPVSQRQMKGRRRARAASNLTPPSSDSLICHLDIFRRCSCATSSPDCRATPATPSSPGINTSFGIISPRRNRPAHRRPLRRREDVERSRVTSASDFTTSSGNSLTSLPVTASDIPQPPCATSSPVCTVAPATPASPGTSTSFGITSPHRICPAHQRPLLQRQVEEGSRATPASIFTVSSGNSVTSHPATASDVRHPPFASSSPVCTASSATPASPGAIKTFGSYSPRRLFPGYQRPMSQRKFEKMEEMRRLMSASPASLTASSFSGITVLCNIFSANRRPDPPSVVEERSNELLNAAWKGQLHDVWRHLYRGAEISYTNCRQQTALHLAAEGGHIKVVCALLHAGASVDARSDFGYTALHRAARGGHRDTLRILLNAGASVDAVNNAGRTALHEAASRGHAKCLDLLLDSGADPKAKDKEGHTPSYLASLCKHKDCARLLDKACAGKGKGKAQEDEVTCRPF